MRVFFLRALQEPLKSVTLRNCLWKTSRNLHSFRFIADDHSPPTQSSFSLVFNKLFKHHYLILVVWGDLNVFNWSKDIDSVLMLSCTATCKSVHCGVFFFFFSTRLNCLPKLQTSDCRFFLELFWTSHMLVFNQSRIYFIVAFPWCSGLSMLWCARVWFSRPQNNMSSSDSVMTSPSTVISSENKLANFSQTQPEKPFHYT